MGKGKGQGPNTGIQLYLSGSPADIYSGIFSLNPQVVDAVMNFRDPDSGG